MEVTIGKLLAYAVQAGFWLAVQIAAITLFRVRPTNLLSIGIALTFFFGITAVISSFWTMSVANSPNGIITTVVNVYLLLLFVVSYGFETEAFSARPIILSMALAGVILPVVGVIQMVVFSYLSYLPGASPGRPPSVTGSYLHFPLLCGVLGIALLEGAKALRWRSLYLISLLCFIGVAISGGRSGTLVLVGAGALYILFEFFRKSSAVKLKFALFALITVGILATAIIVAYQYSVAVQRIAQLGDLQESGNAQRVEIWTEIYYYWRETNLWFGEYTGLVGNTTNNVSGQAQNLVAESGALQQLINFGALGFLSFYGVMLISYFGIRKECTFLRALFVSAMVQTLFYQSTEVLPYMAMLAFLPFFSRSLFIAGGDRYSNQGR